MAGTPASRIRTGTYPKQARRQRGHGIRATHIPASHIHGTATLPDVVPRRPTRRRICTLRAGDPSRPCALAIPAPAQARRSEAGPPPPAQAKARAPATLGADGGGARPSAQHRRMTEGHAALSFTGGSYMSHQGPRWPLRGAGEAPYQRPWCQPHEALGAPRGARLRLAVLLTGSCGCPGCRPAQNAGSHQEVRQPLASCLGPCVPIKRLIGRPAMPAAGRRPSPW